MKQLSETPKADPGNAKPAQGGNSKPTPEDYDVLGLDRSKVPTRAEAAKAYRTQAKLWHPDKNPDKVNEATKRFKKIAAAWERFNNHLPK